MVGSEVGVASGPGVKVGTAHAIDSAKTNAVSTPPFNALRTGERFQLGSFGGSGKSLISFRIQTKNFVAAIQF